MIAGSVVHVRELQRAPDFVDLVMAARDGGQEALLFERAVPDAVSVAAVGKAFEIVSGPTGVVLEDASGSIVDGEDGPRRLEAAARLWRRVAERFPSEGNPALPFTAPMALGGFAFRPDREPKDPWGGFPGLLLRIPALTLVRVHGSTFVITATPSAHKLLDLAPVAFRGRAARSLSVIPVQDPGRWTERVGEAVLRLRAGEAHKVVLAREVIARADGVIAAGPVLRALRQAYPSCFTFLMTGADGTAMVGASPELLVRRTGSLATSQPMAGSVARGQDATEDDRLAAQLAASAKELDEHAVVVREVVAALDGISQLVRAEGPEVVRFANIQHLATTVRAKLAADRPLASVLDLVAMLHPTPAVGGSPREQALNMIQELEGMERGWYAGGVGWLDGRGDGEFAVALRCGLLWEDGARLYAGSGLMPDSDPEAELSETEAKFRALLAALSG